MKNNVIFLIVAFVLLLGVGVYFFLPERGEEEVEREETVELSFEEEEVTFEEPLDLPYSGRVTDFGEDFLILEQTLFEEGVDVFTEDYEPEVISVSVIVDENTEIVDANDIQYVEIPNEHSSGLKALEYISNLEEEYQFSAVVESEDSFEFDGDEIYADVVNWSCFPLNEM